MRKGLALCDAGGIRLIGLLLRSRAIFPLGATLATFSATGGSGIAGIAASTVTGETPDETLVATAAFVPIEVEDNENKKDEKEEED